MNLEKIRSKPARTIIGLMSGTSADGVDAVLCELTGYGKKTSAKVVHMTSLEYPAPVRRLLLDKLQDLTLEEVARLNFYVGEIFAKAAVKCMEEARYDVSMVDAIASHGQTLIHLPNAENADLPVQATLQIGDISVIAQRTGILTIGDFRPADMAQGGQGAPLVPYADYVLFGHPEIGRIVQNIGGIANLTYLPPAPEPQDVVAFDTGPGNMVVDAIVQALTEGRMSMDIDGALAFSGKPDETFLSSLLEHPYFRKAPPKSTGRELFGSQYARAILEHYGLSGDWSARNTLSAKIERSPATPTEQAETVAARDVAGEMISDIVATASELTVRSIIGSYRQWIFTKGPVHEIIVGGGGAKNKYFMERLRQEVSCIVPNVKVLTHEDLGIPDKAKEALAFAILGNEFIGCFPNNLPSATGARRQVIMGKMALP